MSEFISEEETPERFDISYDDERIPQRELTDFVLMRGDERVSICELEKPSPTGLPIVARGRVVSRGDSLKVVTAPLTEWCIEYGFNPSLWIRSANVWYRLTRPARDYIKTHELARRRFEICARIFILCTTENAESGFNVIAQLLSGPWADMRGYTEKEIIGERDFILAQIKNLEDSALISCPFVQELRTKKSSGRKRSTPSSSSAPAGPWMPRGDMDNAAEAKLIKKAEKTLREIMKKKTAFPFNEPVCPKTHGCPDYLERIKSPMDFGTIKKNIEDGKYNNAIEIVKDVRLVASNCRQYNTPSHEFSRWATDHERKMETAMKAAEESERANFLKRSTGNPNKKRKTTVNADGKKNDYMCAREGCDKSPTPPSKYCGEECGLAVARNRIQAMRKAGIDIKEFLEKRATKKLVLARP